MVTDGRAGRGVARGQGFGHDSEGMKVVECRDGGGQGITEKAATFMCLYMCFARTN